MKFLTSKKSLLALGVAAALGMSAAQPAHAGAYAEALLNITAFKIEHGNGTQYTLADFNTISGADTGDASVTLNGTNLAGPNAVVTIPPGGALDTHACLGACPPTWENPAYSNFTAQGTKPPAQTYAIAANQLSGNGLDEPLGNTAGATANTRAGVSLPSSGVGSGSTNLGINSDFTFTLKTSGPDTMKFDFDYEAYLRAYLLPDSQPGSLASASDNFTITITGSDGSTPLSYNPGAINQTLSASTPGLDKCYPSAAPCGTGTGTGHLTSGTASLAAQDGAGNEITYTISLRHTSAANATQKIPEPTVLVLMGAGLLGMGAVRRYTRKAA